MTDPSSNVFQAWPFRFWLSAIDPLYFPLGKAANVLRGAFGSIFRKLACIPECRDARQCDIAASCPYALIFEPRQQWTEQPGPSGLADSPRPFVFRALHLDGKRISPGQRFYFDVILFTKADPVLPYFVLTFRELASDGIGPSRGRATLTEVEDLASNQAIYTGNHFLQRDPAGLCIDLSATIPIERITVHFLTPTELKVDGGILTEPRFTVLFSRLRDRISNLRALYQGGPLTIDFAAMGEGSQNINAVRSTLRQINTQRRSSRTGQTHSIGGFVGEVEYTGDLSPFLPYLKAGEWAGVGRQTVWGKGEISLL